MAISLSPKHLKRYKDIGRLLIRYGRADLVPDDAAADVVEDAEPITTDVAEPRAEQLAADLERLGPVASSPSSTCAAGRSRPSVRWP